MSDSRIADALARIDAAMERIGNARTSTVQSFANGGQGAKVTALVNAHEKLREDVAETMRDLDILIEELEN